MDRDAERTTFVNDLSAVSRKLRTLFDARARDMGLTLPRARLLMQLAAQDGPIQSDLAAILDIEQPTLVRLLDGLERKGLVERRPVEGDRRARRIVLTPAAREQAQDILRFAMELRAVVLQGADRQDVAAASRVIAIMLRNIGAEGLAKP